MQRSRSIVSCGLLWVALLAGAGRTSAAAGTPEQEQAAQEAVRRVVESHDKALLLGGGALMVKQSAIRSARKLLSEWGRAAGLRGEWWDDAPEYRAAKAELLAVADEIIAQRYSTGVWLTQAWTEYTARELDGEQADTIAAHFQTEGGQKLRMLMDWYLGEMVLFNYTFTDRFEYELRESERELRALQQEAHKRIPVEDIEFTSRYPDTFRFVACGPDSPYCPSLKYWRMLIYPLMGEIIRYLDSLSAQIETEMRAREPAVQRQIAAFEAARR
jgi:hypothetical protein